MKTKILLLLFIPALCLQVDRLSAQNDSSSNGIRFEKTSSWQEILERAKSENKYVFVDCYATWCGPCKLMDERTYPSEKVGQYVNTRFISVRMQVDSSEKDDEQIKNMYADVRKIVQQYDVHSFPSFLFFSPDGKIVHRDIGYKDDSDFIKLAMNATDSNRQVYTLLNNYRQGKRNYKIMPHLSSAVNVFDKQLGDVIVDDYITNYLLKLGNNQLFTKGKIYFIGQAIQNSKGAAFNFVLHHSVQVDSVTERNYAGNILSFIIKKEEIDPLLWRDKKPTANTPHWNKIASAVRKKYGKYYSGRTLLDAKLQWYESKTEWPDYCKVLIQRVEKYGPFGPGDTFFQFNGVAWYLFLHSSDKKELMEALAWSDSSLQQVPTNVQCLDTYANLLYKLGRKHEAIEWEQRALDMENQAAQKKGKMKGYFTDIFSATLTKIERGEPTW